MPYKNKKDQKIHNKKYKQEHKEKIKECKKSYFQENKEKIYVKRKKYRQENNKKIRERERIYYQKNEGRMKKYREKYRETHYKTPEAKFSAYKGKAKNRGFNWDLTFEQFKSFWQKPCYFCGSDIETIGLDRLNNKKGYEMSNVVVCCSVCNYMKKTMTEKEFIDQCKKIVKLSG